MPERFIDWINLGVAGLMGLLWLDIRNVRKEKETHSVDLEKRFQTAREDGFSNFLTKDKHDLLCENAGLKIREHISFEIKASEDRMLLAIKELLKE
jgi:hypothetical protein